MAKTSPDLPAEETPVDPFAFVADPTVLVSKRPRRFMVPGVLFERDATTEERARWHAKDADSSIRGELFVLFSAGVNFLGVQMTSWRDVKADHPGQASKVPDMSRAVLIHPATQGLQRIMDNPDNRDESTNRLRPDKVRAVFERIVAYLKDTYPKLWKAHDAYDAPEMMLMPLSHVLGLVGDHAQQANKMATAAVEVARAAYKQEHVLPLGALHDYAIRHRGGGAAAIYTACKAKAAKWQVG